MPYSRTTTTTFFPDIMFQSIADKFGKIPAIPFDSKKKKGIVPNQRGRIITESINGIDIIDRLFITGLLNHGPKCIIGNNISDAQEPVKAINTDLSNGETQQKRKYKEILKLLKIHSTEVFSDEIWRTIDEEKKSERANKNRIMENNSAEQRLKVTRMQIPHSVMHLSSRSKKFQYTCKAAPRLLWTCANHSNIVQPHLHSIIAIKSTQQSTVNPRRYIWQAFVKEVTKKIIPVVVSALARAGPAMIPPLVAFFMSRVLPVLGVLIFIVWLGFTLNLIPRSYVKPGSIVLVFLSLGCCLITWGIARMHDSNERHVFTNIDQSFGTEVARGSKETLVRDWQGLSKPLHLNPRRVSWHFGKYKDSVNQGRTLYINYEWDVDVPSENKIQPFKRLIGKVHSVIIFNKFQWHLERINFENEKTKKTIQLYRSMENKSINEKE